MSNNSISGSIATEIAVMAGTLAAVYGGIWVGKKLLKAGSALKTSAFSKVKP